MKDKVIVAPKPFKGFRRKRVIYIPCDFPNGLIRDILQKIILKEKQLGFGNLFLLKDKIILYQSIGAPAAILSLEPLAVSGAKEIIILGFCGSLNPNYKMTEAAIIQKAISEEGTSRHYFPQRHVFDASPPLKDKLERQLQSRKLPFNKGSTVSTDAPYRETKSWLSDKQKKGIDFVDMETSAVFALAEYYSIQAAALMIISDELFTKKWKKAFRLPRLKEKIREYFLPFLF